MSVSGGMAIHGSPRVCNKRERMVFRQRRKQHGQKKRAGHACTHQLYSLHIGDGLGKAHGGVAEGRDAGHTLIQHIEVEHLRAR